MEPQNRTPIDDALTYYGEWLAFRQRYLRIPGLQVAVRVNDHLAMSRAYGHADLETNAPLHDRHLFRVGSQSKMFTATAVLQLVDRGELRLDDTAGQWVSELRESDAPIAEVTIAELLSHASGMSRDGGDADFWDLRRRFPSSAQLRELLQSNGARTLQRNQRFKYSNLDYALLGLILEAASGQSYRELVQRLIIAPLELHDTGADLDPERAQDLTTGYTPLSHGDSRIAIEHVEAAAFAPAAGFYATATDLVTYLAGHFYGEDSLLSDDAKRIMQHPSWDLSQAERYALGLAVTQVAGRTMIGHGGGFPGFRSYSVADPRDRIAISVLSNATDGPVTPLAHALPKLLDSAGPRGDGHPPELRRFTGRFASLMGPCDVAQLGDDLYVIDPTYDDPADSIIRAEQIGPTTFRIAEDGNGYGSYGETIEYDFDAQGQVRQVRIGALTYLPLERFSLGDRVRAASADSSDHATQRA